MQLEAYPFIKRPESYYYEFYSTGPKGRIKKVVEFFRLLDQELEIYNLSFGDWEENTKRIDDRVASNNSDRDKVLATVAATVLDFMKTHPKASIFAIGSTTSRTRIYQMGIARTWNEINPLFEVQGYILNTWQPFQKGVNYNAFLIKSK
jgi:hypothetical protein